MQQELEQLVTFMGVVVATIPSGISLGAFFSAVLTYQDTKMYYSLTDKTRQKALGRPKFVEILKQDLRNMPTVFGIGEFDSSYDMKYFSAYVYSIKEQENSKYLGYRKIREE